MMRGAWETYYEYILELCTEQTGCFMPVLIRLQRDDTRYCVKVFIDTERGSTCEWTVNEGGTTGKYARPY